MTDTPDIVDRLRSATRDVVTGEPLHPEAWPDLYITDIIEAIDEIERLRAHAEESERDALRARVEKLERALIKEREERLWLAARAVLKETKEARKEPYDA